MRTLKIKTRANEDWAGKFLDESSYDALIDEDCQAFKPDGTMLFTLKKRALNIENVSKAWNGALRTYHPKTNNRGIASGTGYVQKVKRDGTLSKTHRSIENVESGIIGFFERNPRFPYCRPCAWNFDNPEKWALVLPLLQESSDIYRELVPDFYSFQEEYIKKTSQDFQIPGTIFTTVTVNKNFRTAAHRDAGDLDGARSAMALIREGKFDGAHLCFPDFRCAVKLDTADLIIFDPHEFHGNTRIVPMSEKYQRCTLVMYYRTGIQYCGTAEEELERAKNRKLGESLK